MLSIPPEVSTLAVQCSCQTPGAPAVPVDSSPPNKAMRSLETRVSECPTRAAGASSTTELPGSGRPNSAPMCVSSARRRGRRVLRKTVSPGLSETTLAPGR
eukprot:scaffold1900_cov389-Prasinococcus_capsulatus_cf.AAC.22